MKIESIWKNLIDERTYYQNEFRNKLASDSDGIFGREFKLYVTNEISQELRKDLRFLNFTDKNIAFCTEEAYWNASLNLDGKDAMSAYVSARMNDLDIDNSMKPIQSKINTIRRSYDAGKIKETNFYKRVLETTPKELETHL